MIGEAIYIRVSDRKSNSIATKRGNVPTQSWSGKSAEGSSNWMINYSYEEEKGSKREST
jgi:hypothetical protein